MATKRSTRRLQSRRTRRKKGVRLSPEQRRQKATDRRFKVGINAMFTNAGFTQVPTRGKSFEFLGEPGEIDNIYVYENIIVICEDTATSDKHLKEHVQKTGIFLKHIMENEIEFVNFAAATFDKFRKAKAPKYAAEDCSIRYVYASFHDPNLRHLKSQPHLIHLSRTSLRYFTALGKVIHRSMRYEVLKFLRIRLSEIGFPRGDDTKTYPGFVLPETPSGFPPDFKIVTFYIDPETLLELCYVLRKDSWEDTEGLYQRMLIRSKIRSMREYLATQKRAFVNNIIVSLPEKTRFRDKKSNTVAPSRIQRAGSYQIDLPKNFNTIGLIDGQHRVYSYHQAKDKYESKIAAKREKQQLLVTGVVFPKTWSETERVSFEARLFLEINDKQTRTRGHLKQAIQVIVEPFSATAIAKSVISGMAREGPLEGLLEDHYFDDGQIKTTSIVSYGLQHIVVPDSDVDHSLFRRWDGNKIGIKRKNVQARAAYVDYCVGEVNHLIAGFKCGVKGGLWTPDRKTSRALSITTINGLIYCLRLLIAQGLTGDFDYYRERFQQMKIDFRPKKFEYKSSHWRPLGVEFAKLFGITPAQ